MKAKRYNEEQIIGVLREAEAGAKTKDLCRNLEFADWRFNLRSSNTEPLLRLNVEARGDNALLERKTRELLELLR